MVASYRELKHQEIFRFVGRLRINFQEFPRRSCFSTFGEVVIGKCHLLRDSSDGRQFPTSLRQHETIF